MKQKIPKHIEDDLLSYLETKPLNKKTVVFNTADIYMNGRKALTHEIRANRRRLGKTLTAHIRDGNSKIAGYNISFHSEVIPKTYVATKTGDKKP